MTRTIWATLATTVLILIASGCKKADPLYCRLPDRPCENPARPFCDERGEYPASEKIAHTCIPTPVPLDGGMDTDSAVDAAIDATLVVDAGDPDARDAAIPDAATPLDAFVFMDAAVTPVDAALPLDAFIFMDAAILDAAPPDAACTSSTMCNNPTPICAGACRACSSSTECMARDTSFGICDQGRCVGCTDDTQCASGICDPHLLRCLAFTEVVYVATTGSTNTGCGTMADRCQTLALGIAKRGTRRGIHISAGSYTESTHAFSGGEITIVGNGATITGTAPSILGSIIMGHVTVRGVTFQNTRNGTAGGGAALYCESSGAPGVASMTAERCVFRNNDGGLIGLGTGCSIRSRRNRFELNDYGLGVEHGVVESTNSIFVRNKVGAQFGNAAGATASGVFVYNTVADNTALNPTAPAASGLVCAAASVVFANNIVFGNAGGNMAGCPIATSSIIGGGGGAGGNIDSDPLFVNSAAGDYHITTGSPAKNAANSTTHRTPVDFDGQTRPMGIAYDIGADETP